MLGAIAMLQYLAIVFDAEGSGVDCSNIPPLSTTRLGRGFLPHLGVGARRGAVMKKDAEFWQRLTNEKVLRLFLVLAKTAHKHRLAYRRRPKSASRLAGTA